MTRAKTPADPTLEQFAEHAKRMRRIGATKVRVATKTVELEAEFARPRAKKAAEKQPAIGFAVEAAPGEYDE